MVVYHAKVSSKQNLQDLCRAHVSHLGTEDGRSRRRHHHCDVKKIRFRSVDVLQIPEGRLARRFREVRLRGMQRRETASERG